jgi:hypothetical protein
MIEEKAKQYERFFSKPIVEKNDLSGFTIGIIVNGTNARDINYYQREFGVINRHFKGKVKVMFIGGDPLLSGVKYECTKPVSIIHYEKHLRSLNIDLLFIPLEPNNFNLRSEDYKKFGEAAQLQIPVITNNIYPYNAVIENRVNGFLYEGREAFLNYLNDLLVNQFPLIKIAGKNAEDMVVEHLGFSEGNVNEIINAFD